MAVSIAKASVYLEELLLCIENLYWEANDIPSKDLCFNLIRLLHSELTELNKVSVQDHHYDYEIIAYPPTTVIEAVEALQAHLPSMVLRTQTGVQIGPLLENRHEYF